MNIRYDMLRVMTDRRFKALMILGVLLLSGLVSAQTTALPTAVCTIVCNIFKVILMVAIFIGGSMLVLYGAKWTMSADDPSARSAAKTAMIHVIIALFVTFVAFWLVSWLISMTGTTGFFNPQDLLTESCNTLCNKMKI